VTTSFWDYGRYLGTLFYDFAKATLNRLAFALAEELRPHGVASVALSPGWMRTEIILAAYKTDETRWRDVPALARTDALRRAGGGRARHGLAGDGQDRAGIAGRRPRRGVRLHGRGRAPSASL
jgi:NAD(P)-dependent dehydrogenase (short-subunit alcohol dehydrogenase family)